MFKLFFPLTLIFTICIAADCERQNSCSKEYKFVFSVSLAPELDTFHIGDTIWINFEYNNNALADLSSGNTISANDFEFYFEMYLGRFDSISVNDGLDYFEYSTITGNISRQYFTGISLLNFDFEENAYERKLQFYLIPNLSGNYLIGFESILNSTEVEFIDPICQESLDISFKLNDGINNNFEFYKENSIDTLITPEGFQEGGLFAFSVVD